MKIPDTLVQNYLERRVTELKTIEDALKIADFCVLFKIGHQLKGNGMMFGFPAISEIGALIESSSLIKNKNEIEDFINQYRTILQSIIKNH